jgi:hypothetical protein
VCGRAGAQRAGLRALLCGHGGQMMRYLPIFVKKCTFFDFFFEIYRLWQFNAVILQRISKISRLWNIIMVV